MVTQSMYGCIDAVQDPHLSVQKINGIMCIRDKNPTGLPIVNEEWFQYADDQISRITPVQVQEPARNAPDTQVDDPSSGDEIRSPSESPTEPTRQEPAGSPTSAHKAPFSLAEAILLQSHVEAIVSPTRNTTSLVPESQSVPPWFGTKSTRRHSG